MRKNCRGIENQNQIGWYFFAGEFIVAMDQIILSVLYDHEVGLFFLHKLSDFALSNTSTKARIFPWRFSTFHTFWCKIGSKMNLPSLYRRLLVAVSMMVIFPVAISTPSTFNVAVSTELHRYSDSNVKLT